MGHVRHLVDYVVDVHMWCRLWVISCEFGVVGASQLALLREGAVSVRVLCVEPSRSTRTIETPFRVGIRETHVLRFFLCGGTKRISLRVSFSTPRSLDNNI